MMKFVDFVVVIALFIIALILLSKGFGGTLGGL